MVAVPFRACDVPAERAEFAHPDVLICLTCISYYNDGLDKAQVKQAVGTLLNLAPEMQRAVYNEWFALSRDRMSVEERSQLDDVGKLDMSNGPQFKIVMRSYRFNMRTINFWLTTCVLPRETKQFPKKIMANAWDLTAANARVVGFSGTKDTKLLLPAGVTQVVPDDATLAATDGKMLDVILGQPGTVHVLTTEKPQWTAVLDFAIENGTVALLDAGALMAGATNHEVALKVLDLLDRRATTLQGVVYFNKDRDEWSLISRATRTEEPARSPILDAFVYFDMHRCRGSDLKLRPDAVATLTIGPFMPKDRLMQAAGRMRQLDAGQSLRFVVPPDVAKKIADDHGITSSPSVKQLVQWVMTNVFAFLEKGLPEWGRQGSHFYCTQDPGDRLLPEEYALEAMYGHAVETTTAVDVIRKDQDTFRRNMTKAIGNDVMAEITRRAVEYGSDITTIRAAFDEECERELENEREVEKQIERQLPKQIPRSEVDWDYTTILTASNPQALPGIRRLGDAVSTKLSPQLRGQLQRIQWGTNVFVTNNFIATVVNDQNRVVAELDEYLRLPDALLVYPSGDVLLVSEREAEHIIELYQNWSSSGPPQFRNRALVARAVRKAQHVRLQLPLTSLSSPCTAESRAVIGLFSGDTMFDVAAATALQAILLPNNGAKKAAKELPVIRGRKHFIPRSTLELVCDED